jgi:hypothetical protein
LSLGAGIKAANLTPIVVLKTALNGSVAMYGSAPTRCGAREQAVELQWPYASNKERQSEFFYGMPWLLH